MTTEMIISGVIGLITGAIGSLIAPWIHWGIEKRKIRHENRKQMINEVRVKVQDKEYDRLIFRETSIYSQIKPFLDMNTISKIELPSDQIEIDIGELRGSGIQNYKNQILDNLTKLEKKWRLL